jgi:hypothetical protein
MAMDLCCIRVPFVQKVQIVQTPSFILPRVAGEERDGGIERSEAVERLERFERNHEGFVLDFILYRKFLAAMNNSD